MGLFAKDESIWSEAVRNLKERFARSNSEKEIIFTIADKNPKILINQIAESDAIYLHGGREHLIREVLDQLPSLIELWKDKIVAGSSAGAHVLSKYYYSVDLDRILEGYGFQDIKTFCHFGSQNYNIDYPNALKELKNHNENLPVYTIKETEFVVLTN